MPDDHRLRSHIDQPGTIAPKDLVQLSQQDGHRGRESKRNEGHSSTRVLAKFQFRSF